MFGVISRMTNLTLFSLNELVIGMRKPFDCLSSENFCLVMNKDWCALDKIGMAVRFLQENEKLDDKTFKHICAIKKIDYFAWVLRELAEAGLLKQDGCVDAIPDGDNLFKHYKVISHFNKLKTFECCDKC